MVGKSILWLNPASDWCQLMSRHCANARSVIPIELVIIRRVGAAHFNRAGLVDIGGKGIL